MCFCLKNRPICKGGLPDFDQKLRKSGILVVAATAAAFAVLVIVMIMVMMVIMSAAAFMIMVMMVVMVMVTAASAAFAMFVVVMMVVMVAVGFVACIQSASQQGSYCSIRVTGNACVNFDVSVVQSDSRTHTHAAADQCGYTGFC